MKKVFENIKNFGKGILIGALIMSPFYIAIFSAETYYKSDMYADTQKEFILDNIDSFKVVNGSNNYTMLMTDDVYYEEVKIYLDESNRIIFWADREKLKKDEFWQSIKWRFIGDTDFALDYSKDLDRKIKSKLEIK